MASLPHSPGRSSEEIKRSLRILDAGLEPYEKKLRAMGDRRRRLGVKKVERPTYERYITGPIERFDRRRMAFLRRDPENPWSEGYAEAYASRADRERSMAELEVGDRIARSLQEALWKICFTYNPDLRQIPPKEAQVPVDDLPWMTRLVKKVALFFGAEIVGITRIDQRWVYKHVDISHEYAIVIGVTHQPYLNILAPSYMAGAAVYSTYSRLKVAAVQLAEFIRGMGYDAVQRETLAKGAEMLMVPLAIDAGIGEFARTGRCLSPEFGTNMRLKAVTTDLPLEVDSPISFGVHEFCSVCGKCAMRCPAQAIPRGPPTETPSSVSNNPGYRKWYIDAEKCLLFWGANSRKWSTCGGRCIAVCPWNKSGAWYHDFARWVAINLGTRGKKALVRLDDIMGYGKRPVV